MPAQSKTKLPATLIPGDGIGPEIVKSAVDILEALGSPVRVGHPPGRPGGHRGKP